MPPESAKGAPMLTSSKEPCFAYLSSSRKRIFWALRICRMFPLFLFIYLNKFHLFYLFIFCTYFKGQTLYQKRKKLGFIKLCSYIVDNMESLLWSYWWISYFLFWNFFFRGRCQRYLKNWIMFMSFIHKVCCYLILPGNRILYSKLLVKITRFNLSLYVIFSDLRPLTLK